MCTSRRSLTPPVPIHDCALEKKGRVMLTAPEISLDVELKTDDHPSQPGTQDCRDTTEVQRNGDSHSELEFDKWKKNNRQTGAKL
ncbi:hypothetical protein CDD80_4399 [Ophiocordyceps camponoti-rufipedis]|uniref:Uncharacterized protein n=1 Tax=Ophiocordyceps camponoti-rufipedis TaxID=2004952 RepID=A0A2C5YV36_9HYPO|nr:hypothetical protein CDD80_4399 [Ophiocordyceps camponoti-rufipedis]